LAGARRVVMGVKPRLQTGWL